MFVSEHCVSVTGREKTLCVYDAFCKKELAAQKEIMQESHVHIKLG